MLSSLHEVVFQQCNKFNKDVHNGWGEKRSCWHLKALGAGAIFSHDDASYHSDDHFTRLYEETGLVGIAWVNHQRSNRPSVLDP